MHPKIVTLDDALWRLINENKSDHPLALLLRPTVLPARAWEDEQGRARAIVKIEASDSLPRNVQLKEGNYLILLGEKAQEGDILLMVNYPPGTKVEYGERNAVQCDAFNRYDPALMVDTGKRVRLREPVFAYNAESRSRCTLPAGSEGVVGDPCAPEGEESVTWEVEINGCVYFLSESVLEVI